MLLYFLSHYPSPQLQLSYFGLPFTTFLPCYSSPIQAINYICIIMKAIDLQIKPYQGEPSHHDGFPISKGLFTFYRQQQQIDKQINRNNRGLQKSNPTTLNPIKEKSKSKSKSKSQSRSNNNLRDQKLNGIIKKVKKTSIIFLDEEGSKKSQSKRRRKQKNKQKKKKQTVVGQINNGEISNISKTISIKDEQNPTEKFLRKILQAKSAKTLLQKYPIEEHISENIPKQPQGKQTTKQPIQNDMKLNKYEKFNQLFYPKNDEVQDDFLKQSEWRQENIYSHLRGQKQKVVKSYTNTIKAINDLFLQKSSRQLQKIITQKIITPDINIQDLKSSKNSQTSKKDVNVKNNFYSMIKIKKEKGITSSLALHIQEDKQKCSISPPSRKNQERDRQNEAKQEDTLKLPHIKKTKLSKQLKKIEQLISEELVTKSKSTIDRKSLKKLLKNSETYHHILEKQKGRHQQHGIEKRVETQPNSKISLIDIGKPGFNNSGQTDDWNLKKKILFKKLGVNLK